MTLQSKILKMWDQVLRSAKVEGHQKMMGQNGSHISTIPSHFVYYLLRAHKPSISDSTEHSKLYFEWFNVDNWKHGCVTKSCWKGCTYREFGLHWLSCWACWQGAAMVWGWSHCLQVLAFTLLQGKSYPNISECSWSPWSPWAVHKQSMGNPQAVYEQSMGTCRGL